MTQAQYNILIAKDRSLISSNEIMILFECSISSAKRIKAKIIEKIKLNKFEDYNRLPTNNRLPVLYLLQNNYLPFSLEDIKTYQFLFCYNNVDIVEGGIEERKK